MKGKKKREEKLLSQEIIEGIISNQEEFNSIRDYLNIISNVPLLKREEERELIKAGKEGNKEAKSKVIISNLRFVIYIAKRYKMKYPWLNIQDIISAGNIGLVEAFDKFDATKNNKFITYAVHWIEYHIKKHVLDNSSQFKLTSKDFKILGLISKIKQDGIQDNELLDGLDEETAKNFKATLQKVGKLLSIDSNLSKENTEDESFTILDCYPFIDNIEEKLEMKEALNQIHLAMQVLDQQERTVITMRYGIDDGVSKTLEEVGKYMNLSRETIRHIEQKAIKKMRKYVMKLQK